MQLKLSSITFTNLAIIRKYPQLKNMCYKEGGWKTWLENSKHVKIWKESIISLTNLWFLESCMLIQSAIRFVVTMWLTNIHKIHKQVNGCIHNLSSLALESGSTLEMLTPMYPSLVLYVGSLSWKILKASQWKNHGENGGFQESTSTKTKWQEWYGNWKASASCQWKEQGTWYLQTSQRKHKSCSNLSFLATTSPIKVNDVIYI